MKQSMPSPRTDGVASMRSRSLPVILVTVLAILAGCGAPTSSAGTRSTAAAAMPTHAASPTATPTPPIGVAVQSTGFVSQGHPITLIGTNHSGLEYDCTGDGHLALADFRGMRAWGMNVVRLPLSSEFWANAGNDCPGYHQTVSQAVAAARAAGLFVILDLQWSAPFDTPADQKRGGVQCPMPDAGKDLAFWRDLAAQYRGDTGVLFDLYGEPEGVSWFTWRDGGTISSGCYVIGGGALQKEPGTYRAIGMQALVDAVRAVAPENVILAGGTNWGYELSGVAQGYALRGSNLAYDTHPFDYDGKQPADWPASFGATAKRYAVLAGEFGSYTCGTGYIAEAIAYFNAHHISWLAWTWAPYGCGGPSLLAAWPDVPSAPYGAYIKQQMLAASTIGN